MGLFKSLTKAALNIAVLPITAIADAATLGGVLTDEKDPYTVKRLREAKKNMEEALDQ